MHAITLPHEPAQLRESTKSTAAQYIASGIDPEQVEYKIISVIFKLFTSSQGLESHMIA